MGLYKNMPRKGVSTYDSYLRSPAWKSLSHKLRNWDEVCRICTCPDGLQLHHIGYEESLGEEELHNLISVCPDCHEELTHLVKIEKHSHKEALDKLCSKYSKNAKNVIKETRIQRMQCLLWETLCEGMTDKNYRFFRQLRFLKEVPLSVADLVKLGRK